MKQVSKLFKTSICLLLCMLMVLPLTTAFAEEAKAEEESTVEEEKQEKPAEEPAPEEQESIIDDEELRQKLEDYIASKNYNPENISIGYCYTPTGDTWYYNKDKWYYSASMYKVPLFMIMAEGEHEGKLTQDSDIRGMKLSELEKLVLVYSNNDYGHLTMNYIADVPYETSEGNRKCRELYQRYSDMPKEEYVDNFYDYSYFNARFMTDVMETLYFENERFPHVIECLKQAQPDTYFNRTLGDKYEIAQKYGALVDKSNKAFSHTAGIIYTPNPFILTVMTENMGLNDDVIAGFAPIFEEYTLSLDAKLEAFEKEKAEKEQLRLEEEKKAQEEQERIEREQQEEEERKAQEEQERIKQAELQKEKEAKRDAFVKKAVVVIGVIAAAAVVLLVVSAVKKPKKNKRSAQNDEAEQWDEREPWDEEEQQFEAPEPVRPVKKHEAAKTEKVPAKKKAEKKVSKGKYTPRH